MIGADRSQIISLSSKYVWCQTFRVSCDWNRANHLACAIARYSANAFAPFSTALNIYLSGKPFKKLGYSLGEK
jgi:hypothetical protein